MMNTDKVVPLRGDSMPFVRLMDDGHPLCHPACLLLPEMSEAEQADLIEDIKANGQNHPIIVNNMGFILDGRHRWKAVIALGMEPEFELFTGTEAQEIARVMSENVHRRHLTTRQRAAIAADLATLGRGAPVGNRNASKTKGQNCSFVPKPRVTVAEAAKIMHVSEKSVKNARAVKAKDPEEHEKAKRGEGKREKAPSAPLQKVLDEIDRRTVTGEEVSYTALKEATGASASVIGKATAITEAAGPRAMPELPKTAQQKLDAAIKAHKTKLEREFDGRVQMEARRMVEDLHIPALEKQLKELERMLSFPRYAVMTKAEYYQILFCLHEDTRHSRIKEQLDGACTIMEKYKLKMVNDEEEREEARRKLRSNMPRSLAEMLARKGK